MSGHVARMGDRRGEARTRFWWGNLTERNLLENVGVDERIILKWIFKS
jgi:hypothetical protein